MYIYSVFDKVAGKVLCSFSAPNDGMAIRENLPALSRVLPIGDTELRCLGEIDDVECVLKPFDNYHVVSWDSYKFPESPIAPLPKGSSLKENKVVTGGSNNER